MRCQLELARGTIVADGLDEQVQDAEALGDEQQVSDRIEEGDGALDLRRGYELTLDRGELVTQCGHAQLEWVGANQGL
jgi:hypothetical protein